jgi:hypothetical protein
VLMLRCGLDAKCCSARGPRGSVRGGRPSLPESAPQRVEGASKAFSDTFRAVIAAFQREIIAACSDSHTHTQNIVKKQNKHLSPGTRSALDLS